MAMLVAWLHPALRLIYIPAYVANLPPLRALCWAAGLVCSALLYLEYKKLGLPAELHIYAKGGHGFGMKDSGLPTASWHLRVGEWMKAMGWVE